MIDTPNNPDMYTYTKSNMLLLDYFAAAYLQGLRANEVSTNYALEEMVIDSYKVAKMMLEERTKHIHP